MSGVDGVPAESGRPRVVGGYRVVRALGSGARATVWIGHSDQPADVPTVALKMFAHTDADSIAAEVRAYESVDSRHVVRLLDVCTVEAEPAAGVDTSARVDVCLVLEWLGGGSLATLVRQRRRIRAGEAVTLLVSLLRGIRDLHAVGLAHNAVVPTNVLFDQSGRPALICLGHTTQLPPPYADTAVEARRPDWAQLRLMTDLVMERVDTDGRDAELAGMRRALDELQQSRDEPTSCDGVEDAMYAFAQPAPLVLHPTSIPGSAHSSEAEEQAPELAFHRVVRHTIDSELVGRTGAILEAGPMLALKAAVAPTLRRRRKQFLFGAVLAGVVGVVGLAAIPPGAESSDATMTPSATPESVATRTADSSDRPNTTQSVDSAAAPITGDEPVSAVVALLRTRARCSDVACLTRVDQDASPLLSADTVALEHKKTLADTSAGSASLVQRTGDSALVELVPVGSGDQTKPISVLAIKGEGGWRLREIFAN